MKLKLLALLGVVGLMTACETPEECEAELEGKGGAAAMAGTAEDFKANVSDRVYFCFANHDVSPDARRILDQQAAWLKAHTTKATVEGHCDIRGTADYNRALGERRANAAKDALVAAGVDPMRVDTISYGKERPIDPGHTEEAHARNRTAVTVIGG